jgi:ubiquitin-protein ligase E3 C
MRADRGLLDEVARLLTRLHVCDSRHQFRTDDQFWIAGGSTLASDTFVQDAVEAGSDALVAGDGAGGGGAGGRKAAVAGAGELLRVAPYLAPFASRAKVFHTWVAAERMKFAGPAALGGVHGRWITARRNYLFEDAFDKLSPLRHDLKRSLRVRFIDEHGIEEAGIDGGGVYKEFMYETLRLAFSPSLYRLFAETPDGSLYPSPAAHVVDELFEQRFEFIGALLGKALFDGVIVDIPLASFFLSKLLRKFNYPSDLRSLDPELYRNLMFLRKCDDPDVVESLGLNFVAANVAFGETTEEELVRGGRHVPVTARNRIEYIHRVSNYRMNLQIRRQSDAFVRGFSEVIRPEYVQLFSERELQLLISGTTGALDVDDLRRNTKYSGGYSEDSDVIGWFWRAIGELAAEDQARLLQFVTSSPRAPLLGFAYLNPSFCVHRAEGEARLPTASTCMNLLKLPHYRDYETLRAKLQYSLESNSGFDLS